MRRCRELGHLRRWSSIVVPKSAGRTYSEYAPAAPSPNDLKAPLPEKFSVGKNLKLKAVLFQYDLLAGSNHERKSITASSSPSSRSSSSSIPGAPASPSTSFDPLTPSGENLVDEITGVLAARSLRLGVIAGPQTSPREFESFVRQLRQQSIRVTTAVSPEDLELDGVEAGVVRASRELGMGEGRRGGADVLLVGSSNPLLSAATEANMFTARYYPPNSRREGVIQTFVVRDIDEVRTVVEQVNGVSYRS